MQVSSGPVLALWLLGSLVCKRKIKIRAYADQFDIAYNGTRLEVFMSQIEPSLERDELVKVERSGVPRIKSRALSENRVNGLKDLRPRISHTGSANWLRPCSKAHLGSLSSRDERKKSRFSYGSDPMVDFTF